eukprot:9487681-Pyramimonas_sp.AAC.1
MPVLAWRPRLKDELDAPLATRINWALLGPPGPMHPARRRSAHFVNILEVAGAPGQELGGSAARGGLSDAGPATGSPTRPRPPRAQSPPGSSTTPSAPPCS